MDSSQPQQRRGGLVSLSPSQTPRSSDKSARDLRSGDSNSSSKHEKDKGVNVQVLVRCRPLSEDEMRLHTPVVITCNDNRREVSAIQNIANKQIDRTFAFDKVFGPASQQQELYDQAVSPIVYEVLEGYNCTIFAYGQTGTGKTYTMEGGARKKNGEFPSDAGVIPRAVKQIFDILEAQNAEYSMKVTFLELYNEEITDLLAPEESTKFVDDKSKKPIALMEDGRGGVFVRGLEEEIGRAREAGEINKSLLTLGRVINALVEHSGHIPYRDSKLTRLLRDSLGGKTKTCIIATISPSIHCLEETLSTLDYAHRAKNIKNKPEINQKMMKSALIKDLYSEIDRLKQEVYAAREKNGIYIPRDRYLNEEAEKKAMAEKIERMELDSDTKDKQLMELQELYNSQQLLTAELSEKLERTEKKLEQTEQVLFDLEEKHRQANVTIKEKEFLISNLLKSEKALVERSFELRAELENAASDVSSLFAKIERKDKIEDGNKLLVQKFQSQLTQQLEILHKTVAVSVTQQEQQLKDMEEDMKSFVSTKAEATDELRERLGKLKAMYGSGTKSLDDISGELEGNSRSTFVDLNSEVSKHASALEDLFKGIALDADVLLSDLESSLHKQEEKLSAYAQQQREAHARAVETARSISKITVDFFKTLDVHASNLTQIVEEAQSVNDQKLSEFEKKFEECAANEEQQLLQKVAELLASSNARKKGLVQLAVNDLRESATSRTIKLQQEMSTMQESTSSVKARWTVHMDETESHYVEDTSAVESGKKDLEEVLHNCLKKSKIGAQQWRNAQESLMSLESKNVASVDSIVRGGIKANEILRARFSSAVSTALEDADIANKNMLSSIDQSLQLDHDACGNLNSMIIPCCGDLRELKGGHYHKIVEITENAGKCLLDEYVVDEPSCSTPRKRSFNLPSVASIEELRTPAFEELLKSFWDAKSVKQANGDVKHISGAYEAAQSLRDSRVPLTAIN
ncbi:Kinesin-like protein [Trema orientale]|uniref:Kinesin-like protein n=1 Tax=Trema orientale TaxID=63057 RepID=A0A2P5EF53_TREOI|nr:Kinesin-like protein [Trema orientale]